MEASFRHQRSPGSERFLGLFSSPPPPSFFAVSVGDGDELHEDDIFSTATDSAATTVNPNTSPSPGPAGLDAGLRRLPDRRFGILAALPDDAKNLPPRRSTAALHRSATAASASPPSSGARMIPAAPKPKPAEFTLSMPAGKIYHQSAPVNVPVGPARGVRKGWGEIEFDNGVVGDEEEMLPPHEIVARANRHGSPMTTFSVLEGAGRTLKGRDLRRVRNAVWRKTGFLD